LLDVEANVPTYQYACTACGHQLEAVQSFSDEPLTVCPACEGKLRKVFSAVGIVFKGSGFYRNDSRSEKAGSTSPSKDGSTTDGATKEPAKTGAAKDGASSNGASAGNGSGTSEGAPAGTPASSPSPASSTSKVAAGSSA
jgi:putative FmdB family regulatory protein